MSLPVANLGLRGRGVFDVRADTLNTLHELLAWRGPFATARPHACLLWAPAANLKGKRCSPANAGMPRRAGVRSPLSGLGLAGVGVLRVRRRRSARRPVVRRRQPGVRRPAPGDPEVDAGRSGPQVGEGADRRRRRMPRACACSPSAAARRSSPARSWRIGRREADSVPKALRGPEGKSLSPAQISRASHVRRRGQQGARRRDAGAPLQGVRQPAAAARCPLECAGRRSSCAQIGR